MTDFQPKDPAVSGSARVNGSGSASPWGRRAMATQQFPVFANLSTSEFREATSAAHEKLLPRRETIYVEGDPIREVFLLTSGCVKVTQLGPNGQEVILRLNGPSELIGAQGLSAGKHHLATARAIQTSTALVWEASVFESISDRIPSMRRNTARILGERLQEMEERFREISTQKVAPRLSHQLIRLLNQLGRGSDQAVEIGLSREELAQLTGTTLFTVSRLLSQWEKLGIVSSRREAVIVCDIQALTALSEEG
jgi:CRP-like cAMP-binding protein